MKLYETLALNAHVRRLLRKYDSGEVARILLREDPRRTVADVCRLLVVNGYTPPKNTKRDGAEAATAKTAP